MSAVGPLTGFTVAVTAVRRRGELGAALERRGARVVYAPAMRIVAPADDIELHGATKRSLAWSIEVFIATTAVGLRAWLDAASGWGLGEPLLAQLRAATVIAQGPKSFAALRGAGIEVAWTPPSDSASEVLGRLLSEDLSGRRIAVLTHGVPLADLVQTLREAGADVLELSTYRWLPPEDTEPVTRLIAAIEARRVDAVTFTSAPGAAGFLHALRLAPDTVLDALRGELVVAAVGPVAAAPLQALDIPVFQPSRPRLAALVRELSEHIPARRGQTVVAAGHRIEVRGHLVVMDGVEVAMAPGAMSLLRVLLRHPGRVVPRATLRSALSGEDDDEHAIESAVARLRLTLGDSRIVQTVVERGYRLAYEPEHVGPCAHDPTRG
jgi:uroporphyrinogen-III synthase